MQHPSIPPFPSGFRQGVPVRRSREDLISAQSQLQAAITSYHTTPDDETLLEALHQALSRGLDEQSQEVSETLKILWDAEKSRAEIEKAVDGNGERSELFQERVSYKAEPITSEHLRVTGKSETAQTHENEGLDTQDVGVGPNEESQPVVDPQVRGVSPDNQPVSGFVPSASSRLDNRSQSNRGRDTSETSSVLFLNRQLLNEQHRHVEDLQLVATLEAELQGLQQQQNSREPVPAGKMSVARFNLVRARQRLKSQREMIAALQAMLHNEINDVSSHSEATATSPVPPPQVRTVPVPFSSFSYPHPHSDTPHLSTAHHEASAYHAKFEGHTLAQPQSTPRGDLELEQLDAAVAEATHRLQTQRDQLAADVGEEEAENIAEMVLSNPEAAHAEYSGRESVLKLVTALDELEHAQTRRNEYFLVGKMLDRQLIIREVKRITNPKITKISKIIKKLSSVFSDVNSKVDAVTSQQEKLAEDIDHLISRMERTVQTSKSTTRRMTKLETKIAGIYKLLGIAEGTL